MHFLFISSLLGRIGGTETLIARMSKWLVNHGHQVTLVANTLRESRELYHKDVRLVDAGDGLFDLCFYHRSQRLWRDLRIERPDVIKTFDLTAAWIATVLCARLLPPPKVVFGNYFPDMIPASRNPLRNRTRRLMLLNLGLSFATESILCVTQEEIAQFQHHFEFGRLPTFWPLPIENFCKDCSSRAPKWGKIVSIGRLDPMKEYNLYMIDVIARLRPKGLAVTWTVYGTGSFGERMKSRIAALGLGEVIDMRGSLPYAQFASAVSDAYIFVGMGTAMIEANMCGVPGVVALGYDAEGITHGSVYRFTFGNAGERMQGVSTFPVEAELERILRLSKQDYDREVLLTREYVKGYDMNSTMERFLGIVEKALPAKPVHALFYWYYLDRLVNRLLRKPPPGASRSFFSARGDRPEPKAIN
jgi:glycosyltransferase involved in cell wall biosynthesis